MIYWQVIKHTFQLYPIRFLVFLLATSLAIIIYFTNFSTIEGMIYKKEQEAIKNYFTIVYWGQTSKSLIKKKAKDIKGVASIKDISLGNDIVDIRSGLEKLDIDLNSVGSVQINFQSGLSQKNLIEIRNYFSQIISSKTAIVSEISMETTKYENFFDSLQRRFKTLFVLSWYVAVIVHLFSTYFLLSAFYQCSKLYQSFQRESLLFTKSSLSFILFSFVTLVFLLTTFKHIHFNLEITKYFFFFIALTLGIQLNFLYKGKNA